GSVVGRAVIEGRVVQLDDVAAADEGEFPLAKKIARQTGHRTGLAAPLLRENVAIGALVIRRLEVRPFSEKQIALLKTSPTCPTSCGPRSTPSSAIANCWRRRPETWTAGAWCPTCRRSPSPPNTSSP